MMSSKPSKADTDLWYKAMGTHYEYKGTYDKSSQDHNKTQTAVCPKGSWDPLRTSW